MTHHVFFKDIFQYPDFTMVLEDSLCALFFYSLLESNHLVYNFCCCHGYQIQEFKLIIYDSVAMETTVLLTYSPKTYIFSTTFFISIKNYFYIILFVAMVTKLKNLS